LLAGAQREAGHDVIVAVVLDADDRADAFCSPLDAAGVRVVRWQVPRRRYDLEHASVAELCRQLGPTVVHTRGYRADVVAAHAVRRSGVPVVSTAHGFTGGGWKNRLFQTMQCRSYRRSDAVIAVSRPLARELARRGVPGDRIHVILNGSRTDGARLVFTPAGRRWHGEKIEYLMSQLYAESGAFRQYQVIQTGPDHLRICLVTDSEIPSSLEQRIVEYVGERLDGMHAEVERVDRIGRAPSGKIRGVKNDWLPQS
jgi:glycosyltransferase involved in cell wall biosynthesis